MYTVISVPVFSISKVSISLAIVPRRRVAATNAHAQRGASGTVLYAPADWCTSRPGRSPLRKPNVLSAGDKDAEIKDSLVNHRWLSAADYTTVRST